jgi:predicted RNase H-like HicB family nuclease
MEFHIQFDREKDGRWIADVTELPGVLAYGTTKKEAKVKAEALALRVLADSRPEAKRLKPKTEFSVAIPTSPTPPQSIRP